MGTILPYQGILRTSTEDTPPLRCNIRNDVVPSIQRCTGGNKPKNQAVNLHGLWLS